jgi:geranylgeranyl diphosphate synthase type I
MLFTLSRIALHRLTELGFSDAKVLRLMRLYDETCVALCEGQYMDIWAADNPDAMNTDLYFDMIGRKTAALIAASIEAGALLATDDEEVIAGYRRFGWALGIAFQLNDDLLGIWGDETVTGKKPSDLARHKKTLPIIHAVEHADPADRARLLELIAGPAPSDADVAAVVAILETAGSRAYTRDQARLYRDEALTELDGLAMVDDAARDRLREIITAVISA